MKNTPEGLLYLFFFETLRCVFANFSIIGYFQENYIETCNCEKNNSLKLCNSRMLKSEALVLSIEISP